MIDPNRVEEILKDCLFNEDEITEGEIPDGAIIASGIVQSYGLHPKRLESHREEVRAMLLELPDEFMQSKGGGTSFLNACLDREGNQWTGLHQRMGQLFCLGEGLDLVECPIPRELWSALPGGVPYYVVKDETERTQHAD